MRSRTPNFKDPATRDLLASSPAESLTAFSNFLRESTGDPTGLPVALSSFGDYLADESFVAEHLPIFPHVSPVIASLCELLDLYGTDESLAEIYGFIFRIFYLLCRAESKAGGEPGGVLNQLLSYSSGSGGRVLILAADATVMVQNAVVQVLTFFKAALNPPAELVVPSLPRKLSALCAEHRFHGTVLDVLENHSDHEPALAAFEVLAALALHAPMHVPLLREGTLAYVTTALARDACVTGLHTDGSPPQPSNAIEKRNAASRLRAELSLVTELARSVDFVKQSADPVLLQKLAALLCSITVAVCTALDVAEGSDTGLGGEGHSILTYAVVTVSNFAAHRSVLDELALPVSQALVAALGIGVEKSALANSAIPLAVLTALCNCIRSVPALGPHVSGARRALGSAVRIVGAGPALSSLEVVAEALQLLVLCCRTAGDNAIVPLISCGILGALSRLVTIGVSGSSSVAVIDLLVALVPVIVAVGSPISGLSPPPPQFVVVIPGDWRVRWQPTRDTDGGPVTLTSSALSHSSAPDIPFEAVSSALYILQTLALDHGVGGLRANLRCADVVTFACQAIERVLNSLGSPPPPPIAVDVVTRASAILNMLADDSSALPVESEENSTDPASLPLSSRALTLLCRALENFTDDDSVVSPVLAALGRMARVKVLHELLASVNATPSVIMQLKRASVTQKAVIAQSAALFIASVLSGSSGPDGTEEVAIYTPPQAIFTALMDTGPEALVRALVEFPQLEGLCSLVCWSGERLCVDEKQGASVVDRFVQLGAIPATVNLLKCLGSNPIALRHVLGFLDCLTLNGFPPCSPDSDDSALEVLDVLPSVILGDLESPLLTLLACRVLSRTIVNHRSQALERNVYPTIINVLRRHPAHFDLINCCFFALFALANGFDDPVEPSVESDWSFLWSCEGGIATILSAVQAPQSQKTVMFAGVLDAICHLSMPPLAAASMEDLEEFRWCLKQLCQQGCISFALGVLRAVSPSICSTAPGSVIAPSDLPLDEPTCSTPEILTSRRELARIIFTFLQNMLWDIDTCADAVSPLLSEQGFQAIVTTFGAASDKGKSDASILDGIVGTPGISEIATTCFYNLVRGESKTASQNRLHFQQIKFVNSSLSAVEIAFSLCDDFSLTPSFTGNEAPLEKSFPSTLFSYLTFRAAALRAAGWLCHDDGVLSTVLQKMYYNALILTEDFHVSSGPLVGVAESASAARAFALAVLCAHPAGIPARDAVIEQDATIFLKAVLPFSAAVLSPYERYVVLKALSMLDRGISPEDMEAAAALLAGYQRSQFAGMTASELRKICEELAVKNAELMQKLDDVNRRLAAEMVKQPAESSARLSPTVSNSRRPSFAATFDPYFGSACEYTVGEDVVTNSEGTQTDLTGGDVNSIIQLAAATSTSARKAEQAIQALRHLETECLKAEEASTERLQRFAEAANSLQKREQFVKEWESAHGFVSAAVEKTAAENQRLQARSDELDARQLDYQVLFGRFKEIERREAAMDKIIAELGTLEERQRQFAHNEAKYGTLDDREAALASLNEALRQKEHDLASRRELIVSQEENLATLANESRNKLAEANSVLLKAEAKDRAEGTYDKRMAALTSKEAALELRAEEMRTAVTSLASQKAEVQKLSAELTKQEKAHEKRLKDLEKRESIAAKAIRNEKESEALLTAARRKNAEATAALAEAKRVEAASEEFAKRLRALEKRESEIEPREMVAETKDRLGREALAAADVRLAAAEALEESIKEKTVVLENFRNEISDRMNELLSSEARHAADKETLASDIVRFQAHRDGLAAREASHFEKNKDLILRVNFVVEREELLDKREAAVLSREETVSSRELRHQQRARELEMQEQRAIARERDIANGEIEVEKASNTNRREKEKLVLREQALHQEQEEMTKRLADLDKREVSVAERERNIEVSEHNFRKREELVQLKEIEIEKGNLARTRAEEVVVRMARNHFDTELSLVRRERKVAELETRLTAWLNEINWRENLLDVATTDPLSDVYSAMTSKSKTTQVTGGALRTGRVSTAPGSKRPGAVLPRETVSIQLSKLQETYISRKEEGFAARGTVLEADASVPVLSTNLDDASLAILKKLLAEDEEVSAMARSFRRVVSRLRDFDEAAMPAEAREAFLGLRMDERVSLQECFQREGILREDSAFLRQLAACPLDYQNPQEEPSAAMVARLHEWWASRVRNAVYGKALSVLADRRNVLAPALALLTERAQIYPYLLPKAGGKISVGDIAAAARQAQEKKSRWATVSILRGALPGQIFKAQGSPMPRTPQKPELPGSLRGAITALRKDCASASKLASSAPGTASASSPTALLVGSHDSLGALPDIPASPSQGGGLAGSTSSLAEAANDDAASPSADKLSNSPASGSRSSAGSSRSHESRSSRSSRSSASSTRS